MRKYLYGKAALDRWNIPCFRGLVENPDACFPEEEIVFQDPSSYYSRRIKQFKCRDPHVEEYCSDHIASLPLLFLRAAGLYSFSRHVLLGTQICANREDGPPLATVKELRECARKLEGFAGRNQTLRALRYVREHSHSPMESLLCLLLTLPNSCGGMGIDGLRMNVPIRTRKYKSKVFIADFLHARTRSIIEFDSFHYHNNTFSFSADNIRAADLEAEGYKVISVKPGQLNDIRNYEVLMRNIARAVGKRILIRSEKFIEGFVELRELYSRTYRNYTPGMRFIRRHEIPRFPGVGKVYEKYRQNFYQKQAGKPI